MRNRRLFAGAPLAAFIGAFAALCFPGLAADLPTCAALQDNLTVPRWLSLPQSRLVINPWLRSYGAGEKAPPLADSPLALDLGYFAGENPARLSGFWTWQPQETPKTRFAPPLDLSDAAQWRDIGTTGNFADGKITVTSKGDFGARELTVLVDLDETPDLRIQVAATTGNWAVKVRSPDNAADTALIGDNSATGDFTVNLPALTGWHGRRSFTLRLFAIGAGRSVTISRIQFFRRAALPRFVPQKTTWFPHQIITNAAAPASKDEKALEVQSAVLLPDENSVSQRLRIEKGGASVLRLTGQFSAGEIYWNEAAQTLTLRGADFYAVLAFSRPAVWLGVRPAPLDWQDANYAAQPGIVKSGVWAMTFADLKSGEEVVATARFVPASEISAIAAASAKKMAASAAFAQAQRYREQDWNRRLTLVPRPLNFTLNAVEPLGVTPAEIRRTYYRAWVFLLANTLPPMPENNFPYPQCACGKPSLWNEGAPKARPSAQWESFLAMQALALVDPETAWNSCEGQLSLVGADGSLNGEGLPSCHAQTVWTLYANDVAPDAMRLRRVYPALKRLLQWKIANPRWIYHNTTPPDLKDEEFVVHALIDTEYAIRIARELKMPEEVSHWQIQRKALAANFHRWFRDGESGPIYRLYETNRNVRTGANDAWNLQALLLPPDILPPGEKESLLASYHALYNQNVPFLIPHLTRFPNYEFVRRGLFQCGLAKDASALSDAAMRDVTRAGEFSEYYAQESGAPQPDGVRPSVFGSREMLDSVFWHNGVIFDEGLPVLIGLGETETGGGVENLRVYGKPLAVSFGLAGRVTLAGAALQSLRLPPGFSLSRLPNGTLRWQGQIAAGQEMRLEER